MKQITVIRFGIGLLFIGLILVGRYISPVDDLSQISLDTFSVGDGVTAGGALGFITHVGLLLYKALRKKDEVKN